MRCRIRLEIVISRDESEQRNRGNDAFSVVSDIPLEGGSWQTKVPAGATDLQVPLINVASATMLALVTFPVDETDDTVPLTFKFQSALGEDHDVRPIGEDVDQGLYLITTAGITALYVTNADPDIDMYVAVFCVGD